MKSYSRHLVLLSSCSLKSCCVEVLSATVFYPIKMAHILTHIMVFVVINNAYSFQTLLWSAGCKDLSIIVPQPSPRIPLASPNQTFFGEHGIIQLLFLQMGTLPCLLLFQVSGIKNGCRFPKCLTLKWKMGRQYERNTHRCWHVRMKNGISLDALGFNAYLGRTNI